MARDIDETYINNYNPEWIQAWDANMDISLCFDFFAVIVYITEYFTKDESGTSNLLKIAAKHCSEMSSTDQKRCIKNVFLKNRQMGISEAFMKLLPENKLKDSSIGTEFLPHGKREDISRFVVRADIQNSEEEPTLAYHKVLFKVPGREGLYYEKPNWIDKYFRRGKNLEDICPSHLVKMFDPDTKGISSSNNDGDDEDDDNVDEDVDDHEIDFSQSVKKYGKEAKFHHMITSSGKPGKKLPKYIELENPCPGEPRFLRRKKAPKSSEIFQSERRKQSS